MEENLRGKITFQGKSFFRDNILNSTAISLTQQKQLVMAKQFSKTSKENKLFMLKNESFWCFGDKDEQHCKTPLWYSL